MPITSSNRLIKIGIFAALLVGVFILVFTIFGNDKNPVSAKQVSDALSSLGFEASDTTEDYRKAWSVDEALQNAVSCETDNLRFDFFVFIDNDTASYIKERYSAYISDELYIPTAIERKEGIGKNTLHAITASGVYTICVRVDNTVVFAYCSEENASVLNSILQDIGYLDKDNK